MNLFFYCLISTVLFMVEAHPLNDLLELGSKPKVIHGDIHFDIVVQDLATVVEEQPGDNYPCSVCQQVYTDTCFYQGSPCINSSSFQVQYSKGVLPNVAPSNQDTCSVQFSCPPKSRLKIAFPDEYAFMNQVPAEQHTTLFCQESEPASHVGVWYLKRAAPIPVYQMPVAAVTCEDLSYQDEQVITPDFPCRRCYQLYSEHCLDTDSQCLSKSAANITYQLGALSTTDFYNDQDTCSTTFKCPPNTTTMIRKNDGTVQQVTGEILAVCQDFGFLTSTWKYKVEGSSQLEEIRGITCRTA